MISFVIKVGHCNLTLALYIGDDSSLIRLLIGSYLQELPSKGNTSQEQLVSNKRLLRLPNHVLIKITT